ncbi:MAG: hypothetical protein KAG96_05970 [Ichthyobacteriaceae bacterium]|nr:hypothetical protein [Ichthyobacteriaceae bacterium]
MDKAMKIIAAIVLTTIAAGGILSTFNIPNAKMVIGFGILGLMFVLMPFFLFWRYDKKQQLKQEQNNNLNYFEQLQNKNGRK